MQIVTIEFFCGKRKGLGFTPHKDTAVLFNLYVLWYLLLIWTHILPLDVWPMFFLELIFRISGLPAETSIERFVTIGAYSLLRSCIIEPECIIGQHSILMEGSLVETHSILEAGSVLPPGRRIPTGELWAGNPARFVRALTHEETLEIPKLAVAINDLSKEHSSEFLPYSTVYLEVEKFKKSLGISI